MRSSPILGQLGKPHPQDPQNEKKRLYKVFDRIDDSRSHETAVGSGLHGVAKVPGNKAYRTAMASALTNKASGLANGLGDLFGAPAGQQEKKEKKAKKEKKELTREEEMQKNFDKNLTQCLVCCMQHVETQIMISHNSSLFFKSQSNKIKKYSYIDI